MISPLVAQWIAADRGAELQRAAAAARLAALARCCQPGTWARTAGRVTVAVARLRTAKHRDRAGAAVCCAGA